MADVQSMPVDRICKTGAAAGDYVRCVSSKDPRYIVGQKYLVIVHFGRAHLSGLPIQLTTGRGKVKETYQIPVEGFGAMWVKV